MDDLRRLAVIIPAGLRVASAGGARWMKTWGRPVLQRTVEMWVNRPEVARVSSGRSSRAGLKSSRATATG